jgi:hypothetical protein
MQYNATYSKIIQSISTYAHYASDDRQDLHLLHSRDNHFSLAQITSLLPSQWCCFSGDSHQQSTSVTTSKSSLVPHGTSKEAFHSKGGSQICWSGLHSFLHEKEAWWDKESQYYSRRTNHHHHHSTWIKKRAIQRN